MRPEVPNITHRALKCPRGTQSLFLICRCHSGKYRLAKLSSNLQKPQTQPDLHSYLTNVGKSVCGPCPAFLSVVPPSRVSLVFGPLPVQCYIIHLPHLTSFFCLVIVFCFFLFTGFILRLCCCVNGDKKLGPCPGLLPLLFHMQHINSHQ